MMLRMLAPPALTVIGNPPDSLSTTMADPPDKLSRVHAGRLRAAERELTDLLAQMTLIGRDGRSPDGRGPGSVPLQAERWERLESVLDRMASAARRIAALAGAPGEAAARRGPGATRAALNARLAQAEEVLRDLRPDRLQARYGDLPPAVAEDLAGLCAQLEALVAEARSLLAG